MPVTPPTKNPRKSIFSGVFSGMEVAFWSTKDLDLNPLAFSGGLGREGGNELLQSPASAFGALRLLLVVLFNAENQRELLLAFQALVLIRRHPNSLLSLPNPHWFTYFPELPDPFDFSVKTSA